MRIVRLDDRETVLRRTADDNDPHERVIVANAAAARDRLGPRRPRTVLRLHRPLPGRGAGRRHRTVAVPDQVRPRAAATPVIERYEPLSVPAVVTQRGGPLDELRGHLDDTVSVLVGHSGVGKSTLINALVPTADRATGVVSAIGKGRHTSSSAVALRLPDRRLGHRHARACARSGSRTSSADDLLWAFPDLEDGATQCLPGCEHLPGEAGCHLDAWVAEGHSTPARLAAFRQLLVSR